MTTPGNPQDSPQGYTQPGPIPPPGQPGYAPPPSQPGYAPPPSQPGYGPPPSQPGYGPPPSQPGYGPPAGPPGYGQQDDPQGPRGASDDQTWAMLSYILALFASIIAPLVIYLVKMNQSRYVRFHAAQALNLGITAFIESIAILIAGILLAVATHGLGILLMVLAFLALGIAHLVYLILGAVRANQGQLFRIPTIICFRMVR